MIGIEEFSQRRLELMCMAGENAAIVLAAAPQRLRNADAPWPYRQDSDFHYLSGFPEPEAVLALLPGRPQAECVLFCREREQPDEPWHGEWIGTARAVTEFGLNDAFPIDDIDDILPGLLEGRERLYCHFGREPEFDAHLLTWMRRLHDARGGGVVPRELMSLGYLLDELRLFKSRAELKLLRRAAQLAVAAHRAAYAVAQPGCYEYAVEAELLRSIRAAGAVPCYPPTVATGKNACILHYVDNHARLVRGDLLLIDAGAEWHYYASDIARTIPVDGHFTGVQRELYDIVQAAQAEAISMVRPGKDWDSVHGAAARVITEGLCALGLLQGDSRAALESEAYQRYFMHKTGHWLGLDVHDAGDYRIDGQPRVLETGMVLAVEPGIYVPSDDITVPAAYRGIGIRIEDVVVVTASDPEVLSADLPTTAEQVEHMLAGRS